MDFPRGRGCLGCLHIVLIILSLAYGGLWAYGLTNHVRTEPANFQNGLGDAFLSPFLAGWWDRWTLNRGHPWDWSDYAAGDIRYAISVPGDPAQSLISDNPVVRIHQVDFEWRFVDVFELVQSDATPYWFLGYISAGGHVCSIKLDSHQPVGALIGPGAVEFFGIGANGQEVKLRHVRRTTKDKIGATIVV